jgi:putative nucleotidyltransferase with HDIG domain
MVRAEERQLETVRAISATVGVADAAERRDLARLRGLVGPIIANDRAEYGGVFVPNEDGVWLRAGPDGTLERVSMGDAGAWWPVEQAIAGEDARGDKYASIVGTPSGWMLVTAGPIRDVNGTTVAVSLAATSMDTLVERIRTEALGDVTIYDYTGTPLATTLVHGDDAKTLTVVGHELINVLSTRLDTPRETRSYAGRDFDLAYGVLTVRGNVVGIYSVAPPSDFISSASAVTRLQMALLVGIAIAAVLLIGFLISKRITDPLLRLVSAAQALSRGDLGARSDVRSADEIGELARTFDQMALSLEQQRERLRKQYLGTIRALTSAIDARDPNTLGHSMRVGQLSRLMGMKMGLPEHVLEHLEVGGYLHDIGKIGIRDAVLLKPGELTTDERATIERHPVVGVEILASVELAPEVIEFVRGHHERLDGTGYPDGRAGEGVSIVMRIAAVADMFDALITERPYKAARELDEVLDVLRRQAGTALDRQVVATLHSVASSWEERVATDERLRRNSRSIEDDGVRRAA